MAKSDYFKCPECGYAELRKLLGDVSYTPCPECGCRQMYRVQEALIMGENICSRCVHWIHGVCRITQERRNDGTCNCGMFREREN